MSDKMSKKRALNEEQDLEQDAPGICFYSFYPSFLSCQIC